MFHSVAGHRAPKTPKKTLTIKAFKSPTLPSDYEDKAWEALSTAVTAVHASQPVQENLQELYRMVETICGNKGGPALYKKLKVLLQERAIQQHRRCIVSVSEQGAAIMGALMAEWDEHCSQVQLIRQIFIVLDRTYAAHTHGVLPIWDLGLRLFHDHVVDTEMVRGPLSEALVDDVRRDRDGLAVDRSLLQRVVDMTCALHIYKSVFEAPVLQSSWAYYSAESQRLMTEYDTAAYLLHVETRQAEEEARVRSYMQEATRGAMMAVMEETMVDTRGHAIITQGMDMFLEGTRIQDLARMYALLRSPDLRVELRAEFKRCVREQGRVLVEDESKDDGLVPALLAFRTKMNTVVKECFQEAEVFKQALRDAFEAFINQRGNKVAELLARYVDKKLRASGSKGCTEEELEGDLDGVLAVFRHVESKDVFEAHYKRLLAKRLLLQKSASTDAEKMMVDKLKAECGSAYTAKLEGMFKDVALSSDLTKEFQDARTDESVDTSVCVLTTGVWPPTPKGRVALVPELKVLQDAFETFYTKKHAGRQLTWQPALGHCVLRAEFPKARKELSVSLFQTAALLPFNDADELPYMALRDASGLEDDELRRTLMSLACGKASLRVLQKHPKGKEISDTDIFRFNKNFTHQLFRIKINQVQMKETKQEQKDTSDRVIADRQYQVDAAVVRIMKSRRRMKQDALATATASQLRFPLTPEDLNTRLKSLLDREYLKAEGDELIYLA